MNVADFDYDLPPSYIAQSPVEPRDSSKLLRLDRPTGRLSHHAFSDIISMLEPDDVLVVNDTRVIPARLRAHKAGTGGAVEILLLRKLDDRRWQALVGGRNVRVGAKLNIAGADAICTVVKQLEKSQRIIAFDQPVEFILASAGSMPLPPYIRDRLADRERYQTVYSKVDGSAAAPTAGLHFTPNLLRSLKLKGVACANCTLHIGLDTFQPVTADLVQDHRIHSEYARLDARNAEIINRAKTAGGRIVAVGTTSARTLETAAILSAGGDPGRPKEDERAIADGPIAAFEAATSLFITPGYRWRAVDAIITNFHLPKSTLLMMISSFAGRERLLQAYETAKQLDYRFFSYGDAMFIT